jgi:TRAP-type C4-dicarboxylate transport system permease small subunit
MLDLINRLTGVNRKVTLMLSIFCLLMAMFFVSADAIARKMGITVPGAISITELFISGLVFGGIVFAQTNQTHLHVGVLDVFMTRSGRLVTDLLGLFVGLVSTGLIAWFGALQAFDSYKVNEIAESTIDFPLWPSRFILAFGSALLCIQFILDGMRLILTRKERETQTLDSAT